MLKYYLELLGIKDVPEFLKKYLECSSLNRLKKVGYFCYYPQLVLFLQNQHCEK